MIIIGKSPTLISGVPSTGILVRDGERRSGNEPETTAHRRTIHARHDRLFGAHHGNEQVGVVALRCERGAIRTAGHLREVTARTERRSLAREHDGPHDGRLVRVGERPEQLVDHLWSDRVATLRVVEPDRANRAEQRNAKTFVMAFREHAAHTAPETRGSVSEGRVVFGMNCSRPRICLACSTVATLRPVSRHMRAATSMSSPFDFAISPFGR